MILVDRTTNGRLDKLLESKDSQLEEHRDANCSNHDPERLNTLFSKSAQQPDGSGCRIELSQFMLRHRFPVLAWTSRRLAKDNWRQSHDSHSTVFGKQ